MGKYLDTYNIRVLHSFTIQYAKASNLVEQANFMMWGTDIFNSISSIKTPQ